ncbi:hypothetical protein DOE73_22570, partial [Paenibacillus dendritiformis]
MCSVDVNMAEKRAEAATWTYRLFRKHVSLCLPVLLLNEGESEVKEAGEVIIIRSAALTKEGAVLDTLPIRLPVRRKDPALSHASKNLQIKQAVEKSKGFFGTSFFMW